MTMAETVGKTRMHTGRFPRMVTLSLDDYENLQELAGATGSANPTELIDLALSALEWVVKNKREGNVIIAEKPDGSPADELLVDLKSTDEK
jgi:hypothetical protein